MRRLSSGGFQVAMAAAALLGVAAFAAPEGKGPYGRWALISSSDVSRSGLADLLLVELQKLRLELVERDRIDKVLGEFELVDALGAEQAGGRLRLGRLLGADALLIVRFDPNAQGQKRQIELLISDCVFGARLRVDRIEHDPQHPERTTAAILDAVRDTLGQFPHGVERILCIPPFVSRSLEHKFDNLQARLAFLLQGAIARHPGVAMLEVSEARNIQRELNISGDSLKAAATPLFVEGAYRVAWNADRRANDYELEVRVSGGTRKPREFSAQFPKLEALIEAVQTDVADQWLDPELSALPENVSDAARIARLAARSDAFARLNLLDNAIEMRQALLLLHPNAGEEALRLLDLYKLRFESRTRWKRTQTAEEAAPIWKAQLDGWREAMGVLERAVRHKCVTQLQTLDALEELKTVLVRFHSYGLIAVLNGRIGGALWQSVSDRVSECGTLYRRFVSDVIPTIRRLPPGEVAVQNPFAPKPSADSEAYARWLKAQIELPDFSDEHGFRLGPDVPADRFRRMVRVMTTHADDALILNGVVLYMIRSVTLDPNRTTDVTQADLEAAIARFEVSPLAINKYYAELARVCARYKYPLEGERPDAAQTLKALQGIADRLRPRLEKYSRRQLRAFLAWVQKTLEVKTQPRTAGAEKRRSKSRRNAAESDRSLDSSRPRVEAVPSRIRATPAPMSITRLDGRTMSMHNQPWAGARGYVDIAGWWLRLVPCGTVDVMFNAHVILLHERPSECRELRFTPNKAESLRSVVWDGELIWIADVDGGIWVIHPDGSSAARVTSADGLPPYGAGMMMQPVSPRRIVVVGASGEGQRAWVADIAIAADKPVVRVVHEATLRFTDAASRSKNPHDPRVTFRLVDTHLVRDALDGGSPLVTIEREKNRSWPLRLDLVDDTVRVAAIGLRRQVYDYDPSKLWFLTNGDFLLLDRTRESMSVAAGSGRYPADGTLVRELYRRPGTRFWGDLFDYKGYLYAPGAEWLRVDPEALKVERLGRGPLWDRKAGDGRGWGVSVHYGLIAWDGRWHFWDIQVAEPDRASTGTVDHIRVVDAENDSPIANAEVVVHVVEGNESVRTNVNGMAAMHFGVGGGEGAQVDAHADGYWSRGLSVTRPRPEIADGVLTIALQRTVQLGGRVVDGAGDGVSGGQIQVLRRPPHGERGSPPDPIVQVGADGRWRAVLPPTDVQRLSLVLAGTETIDNRDTPAPRELPSGRVARLDLDRQTPPEVIESLRSGEYVWSIQDAKRAEVAIRVVGPSGRAIESGQAELVRKRPREVKPALFQNGEIALDRASIRTHGVLVIRADGFAPVAQRMIPGFVPKQIMLERPRPLEVSVRTADGKPVGGARVTSVVESVTLFEGMTDAAGHVRWDAAPWKPRGLKVAKAGSTGHELSDRAAPGVRYFELTPRSVRSVALHVLDKETRQPLTRFVVSFSGQERSVEDGHFSIDVAADEKLDITVRAAGHVSEHLHLAGTSDPDVDVLLQSGDEIAGVLRSTDGRVLADAEVSLWQGAPGAIRIRERGEVSGGKRARTDAQGRFRFDPLRGRCGVLYYGEFGYAIAEAETVVESGELVVRPAARIEGECPSDSGDGSGHEILWTSASNRPGTREYPNVSLAVTTAAGGRFLFENVPPIDGWIARRKSRMVPSGLSSALGLTQFTRPRLIRPRSGETVHVELTPGGRVVVGRIEPREPLSDRLLIAVRLTPRSAKEAHHPWAPGSALCAPDGSFRFPDVAPGRYTLTVERINSGRPVRFDRRSVNVPGGDSSEPLDLGALGPDAPKKKLSAAHAPPRRHRATNRSAGNRYRYAVRFGAIGLLLVALAAGWIRRQKRVNAQRMTGDKRV